MRTRHLQSVTYKHLDTARKRESAPLPYGHVRAGLTTSQITQNQQLTESLNYLESVVANLNYKSFTLYDTLNTAIEDLRVALCTTQIGEDGTDS